MVRPPQPTRPRRRPSRSARRSGVQGKGSAGLQRRAAAATPRPPPKTGGPKRGFPRPSDPVAAAAERLAAAMPTLVTLALKAAGRRKPTALRDQLLRPAFTALELSHQRHLDARLTALTYGLPAPTPGATAGGPPVATDGPPAPAKPTPPTLDT